MIITTVKRSNYVRYHRSDLMDANFVRLAAKNLSRPKNPLVVLLFQQICVMCFWGSEAPPGGPAEKMRHVLTVTNNRKQKKTPANQMNSVLYNYKYMYRRCRNLWT